MSPERRQVARFFDQIHNPSTLPIADQPESSDQQGANADEHQMPSWREVFLYFLFLGFVNVGGPVAQITMMYNHNG